MTTNQKVKQMKKRGMKQKAIAADLGLSLAAIKYHAKKDKATAIKHELLLPAPRKIAFIAARLSDEIAKRQWYVMPSNNYAQVLHISDDLQQITMAIYKSIVQAQPLLDGSNLADFTRKFVVQNFKLWDTVNGKQAQGGV